jgi:RNA polymerase-binding transcription factor DksA
MQPEAPVHPQPAGPRQVDPRQGEPRPSEALDAADADLRAVEATLARIDAGAYGRCAVCNATITAEALAADPMARTCARHETGPSDPTG